MAKSAIGRQGAAMRGLIRHEKESRIGKGILSTLGLGSTFLSGQIKRAETAWDEYEAGYKALGGDPADIKQRGSFWKQLGQSIIPGGNKGFFQMPEQELSIGEGKERRTYDPKNIRKLGALFMTDAGQLLDEESREKIKKRMAPGRVDPLTGELKSPLTQMTGDASTGFGQGPGGLYNTGQTKDGVGFNFGGFSGGNQDIETWGYTDKSGKTELFRKSDDANLLAGKDFQPFIPGGERGRDAAGTLEIQQGQLAEMERIKKLQLGTTVELPEDMSNINLARKKQEYQRRLEEGQRLMDKTGSYNRPQPLSATGEMMAPYKFREQSEVMEQGVQQNPYMPGSPWSPGEDEEYNPFKNLIETYDDKWK